MPMQHPNGLIPDYRAFAYPHHLAPPMFVLQESLNGFGGCEPDSSEAGTASPSEEPSEPDGFADITGDSEKNVKNLFFAINLFENKQPDSMSPGPPVGPDSSPVGTIAYRPFMGGRFGRRGTYGYAGVNGVVPGPHFAAGPIGYYVMPPHIISPASGHYVGDDSPKTKGTGTFLPLSV
jgi:hypothetical protein